jgi:hypothetical protein
MSLRSFFRALCAASLTLGALAACSPTMRGMVDTLRVAWSAPPAFTDTRAEVLARPLYQQRLDSPWGSAVVALGRVNGDRQFWATSSGQVLVLEHGLIRRSVGFPETLEGTHFVGGEGGDPLARQGADPFAAGLHRLADGARSVRELDWMPGYRYGVRVHSRFERVGLEDHDILGERHRLLRIDEHLQAEGVDFAATNRYWVDPDDGFVFVSEQHLLPGLTLGLTQLRPYRGAAR